ncbi:MAG TPA: ArsA-related P-loop ATPase [Acidobacteriota bacterium]|jgi:anion-transporting  ArsA/GET3 family ATPase|nr:ArsA-related P-loop ATPase [Acidobacteriota bacterium]
MNIRVFLGTGGVGKTSVAAAAGLQAALGGKKCLVLTIDPALRLRTALRLKAGQGEQKVPLDSFHTGGELWAAMLDVGATLNRAVKLYSKPEQAEAVLKHPIYHVLVASLAGMQELIAIERLDQAMKDGFDTIIIDTAPSRHAFEFLDKPEFFVQLVSFPIVQLVGRTYKWWEHSFLSQLSRKSLELYSRLEALLGTTLVRQILDFYAVFFSIAEGYADRAKHTASLLRDARTASFCIVTTPLKAGRDGEYFLGELKKRKFPVKSLLMNRIWPAPQTALPPDCPALMQQAVTWYSDVSDAHQRAWNKVSHEFSGRIPNLIRISELPRDIDGLDALHQMSQSMVGI